MSLPIVLIHGYGFDHRIWAPVELAFTGHHVVPLSLPGFVAKSDEQSDPLDAPYTISELAAKFWSEIDPHIAFRVHLAGHSMGGYVCLEMAAQHPERVASLALIHSHVYADSDEKKTQRTATIEEIQHLGHAPLAKRMIPSLFFRPEEKKVLIQKLIDRGLGYPGRAWSYGAGAMRDRDDHVETLKTLMVPVLMVMGDHDPAVPIDWVYRQASLPSNCCLRIYENTGHMSMYEKPTLLLEDLARFYDGIHRPLVT